MLKSLKAFGISLSKVSKYSFGYSYSQGVSNIPSPYKTIGQQLREVADKFPDKPFVISQHQNITLTFRELLERAERVAASLIHLGFKKGDRLGIYSQNNVEWVIAQFATALADLILVNINPAYRTNELKYALEKVGGLKFIHLIRLG